MVDCNWCGDSTLEGFNCKLCGDKHMDKDDIVQEPSHYTRWVIEPITFIMRNSFEFWRGNICKYASRAGFKAYPDKTMLESEIIDLEKVIRYAEMRINELNGETKL